jgi:hypothetical protein
MMVLVKEYVRGPVLIADIAQRESIPRKFLESILLELRNRGILQSRKGKGGAIFSGGSRRRSRWGKPCVTLTDPGADSMRQPHC